MNTYIIIGTVIISLIAEFNRPLKDRLLFNAYAIKHHNQWWRLFTNGFIHADFEHMGVAHLGFNMFALWTFGDYAETFFQNRMHDNAAGSWVYLGFYVSAIPMSSLYAYEKHKNDEWYNELGASGAIAAVLFCFILQHPFQGLGVMFVPIYIPAILFGVLYLAASWYMARNPRDNIAHDAHFFGALYGVLVTVICAPRLVTEIFAALNP